MITIIGVRFKRVGKVYYFDPQGLEVQPGQYVIVETARGVECGECTIGNTDIDDSEVVKPLKKIIRIATQTDLEVARGNEEQAQTAYEICKKKIAEHGLGMHLVSVECTFDLNKILFYFTADGRVDFRELVKDLASIFRTRIELRQIGVRDEAKMLGGLGICGRELCCSSYLEDFQPVSINMAKEQNLSLNPAKISGTCGRLMCCLKYEHDGYREMQKQTPKVDSLVDTPEGRGTVVSAQMLCGTCKVQLEGRQDAPKTFCCGDCSTLRCGRGKRSYAPSVEEDKPAKDSVAEHSTPSVPRHDCAAQQSRQDVVAASDDTSPLENAADQPETAPQQAQSADKPRRRRRGGVRRRKKSVEGSGE